MEENIDEVEQRRMPARAPVKSVDLETRRMEIVVCTAECDRQGDIVEPEGLDFENFKKNPVVLWAHDQSKPPVGRVVEVTLHADQVCAVIEFAGTEFALEIFNLYAQGYLNAWSIGFIPKRFKKLPKSDGGGVHVYEAEVVEISAVPVPANAQALTKALGEVTQLLDSLEQASIEAEDGEVEGAEVDPDIDEIEEVDEINDGSAEFGELLEEFAGKLLAMVENFIDEECRRVCGDN